MKFIYIENFEKEGQRICRECRIFGQTLEEETIYPICKLAKFEKENGRLPNLIEASQFGIDIDTNLEGCPNGYLTPTSKEIK